MSQELDHDIHDHEHKFYCTRHGMLAEKPVIPTIGPFIVNNNTYRFCMYCFVELLQRMNVKELKIICPIENEPVVNDNPINNEPEAVVE